MAIKRIRENGEVENSSNTAKVIKFLSQGLDIELRKCSQTRDLFQCKTCNRKFPSFQALGGHRASHKKPRLTDEDSTKSYLSLETKPKLHECSICRLQFASGQALGGHMRKHAGGGVAMSSAHAFGPFPVVPKLPVLKRSNSCSRRIFGLDLNLTPLENDLDFLFGKMAPKVYI